MLKMFGKILILTILMVSFTRGAEAFGNNIFSGIFSSRSIGGSGFVGGSIQSGSDGEAKEIQTVIDAGYDCNIPGKTFNMVSPAGEWNSYFIPSWVSPATPYLPAMGQQILGIYGGQTHIDCTRDEYDDDGNLIIYRRDFILSNLYYFGTSQY